jgi:hypothetical protein
VVQVKALANANANRIVVRGFQERAGGIERCGKKMLKAETSNIFVTHSCPLEKIG